MSTADDILSEFGDHQCAICGTDCVVVATALDAIPPREPTQAMCAAGVRVRADTVQSIWRAMYDAAIAEKEGK